ncbi:hypothetical protein BD626DRAFT_503353 [Schizophyllum amplum]|uniref:Uncharacterized protein n=1 Tax=Schizophyllum amplum TaxID=97359 RepID=A0A550C8D9_9AGAR|nr:hypothetical protein BD626DRAFT_503353 [Auriculariopsis ampla]
MYNSDLIRAYCDMLPIVCSFLACIKHWAKRVGMNSPSVSKERVTFSSYTLVLMAIAFMQSKNYLPNLQANLSDLPSSTLAGHFWPSAQRVRCDVRFYTPRRTGLSRLVPKEELEAYDPRLPGAQGEGVLARDHVQLESAKLKGGYAVEWAPRTTLQWLKGHTAEEGLEELLREWFKFWAFEFDPRRLMISIRHGGNVPRATKLLGAEIPSPHAGLSQENSTDLWADDHFCVLDPLIRIKNCAHAIRPEVFEDFQKLCDVEGHALLQKGAHVGSVVSGYRGRAPRSVFETIRMYNFLPFFSRSAADPPSLSRWRGGRVRLPADSTYDSLGRMIRASDGLDADIQTEDEKQIMEEELWNSLSSP